MKSALITGITGQDGAYLTELLLEKGYQVHGLKRRSSVPTTSRLGEVLPEISIHLGDLTDANSLMHVLQKTKPDEIYNLAAQSDVSVSFTKPLYTADVNAMGTMRLLETMRLMGGDSRFYQASTSELFGKVQEMPQNEETPFYPRSPYGVSKLFSYWAVKNYREAYDMFACNGILFNHESPRRGELFVTRKISSAIAKIFTGQQDKLLLGNLNALRDWGHAKDFVEMQWLILQQDEPDDYVIATGEQHSVREFVECACAELDIQIEWEGTGLNERGIAKNSPCPYIQPGDEIVAVDPQFFRPSEVDTLLGDPSKAKKQLKWEPKISFEELVSEMVQEDLKRCQPTCASMSAC